MSFHIFLEDHPPFYDSSSVEAKFIPKASSKELKDFRQIFDGPMVSSEIVIDSSNEETIRRYVKFPKCWKIDTSENTQNCSFNSEAFFGSSSISKNEQDIFGEYNASIKYNGWFTEFRIIHEATSSDFGVPLLKAIAQSDAIRLMVEFSENSKNEESPNDLNKLREKNCKISIPTNVSENVETVRSLVIYMFTGLLIDPTTMPWICSSEGCELIGGSDVIANMPIKLSFDLSELYEAAQFLQMKKLMDQIASRCVRIYINMPDVRYKVTSGKEKSQFLAGIIHIAQERNDMKMMEEAIKSSRELNDVFNPLLEMPGRFSKETWDKMLSLKGGLHNKFMFSPCSFMVYMIQFDVKPEDMDNLIEKLKDYYFNSSKTTNGDDVIETCRFHDPFNGMTRPGVQRKAINTFAKIMKPSADPSEETGDIRYSMMRMTISFDFYIIATMMKDNVMYKGCSPAWLKGMISEVIWMKKVISSREISSNVVAKMKAFALQPFKNKKNQATTTEEVMTEMNNNNIIHQQVDLIALSLRTDMICSYYSKNNGNVMSKDQKYEDVPAVRFFSTRAVEAIYKGMQMQAEANKLHLSLRKSNYSNVGSKRRRTNMTNDDDVEANEEENNNNSSGDE